MKAAILHRLDQPLQVVEGIEIPSPARGQVLVKLAYSGVCHSQLMEARGGRGEDRWLPHLLGHEGSGTVLECGEAVSKVVPGQKVVLGWIKGNGIEAGGTRYRKGDDLFNAGAVTTFNTHALVSENRLVPLPEGIPMDQAVLLGCAVPTGMGIVTNTLQPYDGCTIAVFGLGGIGLSALMATGLFPCKAVFAVDVNPDKLALAMELGATHTIDARQQDPVTALREMTNGDGVDFCVEAAGTVRTIEQGFESVRKGGGLCVFASHPASGAKIALDPHDLISGKRIQGSWGGACQPDVDIPRFAELYRERQLPLDKLIDRRYPLSAVNQALDDLERRLVTRPLLELEE